MLLYAWIISFLRFFKVWISKNRIPAALAQCQGVAITLPEDMGEQPVYNFSDMCAPTINPGKNGEWRDAQA